jgi:hypothetical protein
MMFDRFKAAKESYAPPVMPTPWKEPAVEEEICYMMGKTSDGKIAFRLGYSTLTMTKKGCQDLIEQLQVFVKQMPEEE